jgi:hypothetical protein
VGAGRDDPVVGRAPESGADDAAIGAPEAPVFEATEPEANGAEVTGPGFATMEAAARVSAGGADTDAGAGDELGVMMEPLAVAEAGAEGAA